MRANDVRAHFQREDRESQYEADPEPPRHIDKFRIGSGFAAGDFRLERHAADRTGTRPDLPDFRVQRTARRQRSSGLTASKGRCGGSPAWSRMTAIASTS